MDTCTIDFSDEHGLCVYNSHIADLTTVESDICLSSAEEDLVKPKVQRTETPEAGIRVDIPRGYEVSLQQEEAGVLGFKDVFPDSCENNTTCLSVSTQQLVTIGDQQYFLFSVDSDHLVLPPVQKETVIKDEPQLNKRHSDENHLLAASYADANQSQPTMKSKVVVHKSKPAEKPRKESSEETDAVSVPVDVTQAWFTTRDDKERLQTRGNSWKQGQWSKDEVDVLQSNIADYCMEHDISDPTQIIFEMNKDERKNFYRTISRGLNRPLFSVYRRVIRMYDQKNHIGKYTPSEVEKLKELRQIYGSDWSKIGLHMGRSAASVKDRCRLLKECNTGKWYPDEEARLEKAVYCLTGLRPGQSITSGLSWSAVADWVKTRSEKQCRTKWLNYLDWKLRGGEEWTRADDIAIIDKIYHMDVRDENEVNWQELSATWPSSRSPQWLRGKWWSLKRHVPDFQTMSFQELVNKMRESIQNQFKQVQQHTSVSFYAIPPLAYPHFQPSSQHQSKIFVKTSSSTRSAASGASRTLTTTSDVFSEGEIYEGEINEEILYDTTYDQSLHDHTLREKDSVLLGSIPPQQIDEEVVFLLEDETLQN